MAKLQTNPNHLDTPAFLLNFPFSISTDNPNNIFMQEMTEKQRTLDRPTAFGQFLEFYNYLASISLVYLLPSDMKYQDQVYTANLGMVLPHIKDRDVYVVSNFKSEPRRGEDIIGTQFHQMLGYEVYKPETFFEGEAELKYLRDNIYFGGYGMRTDIMTHRVLSEKFDMEIIALELRDPYQYHLDTVIFPIDTQNVMLGTCLFNKKTIKLVERYANIIDIPKVELHYGSTNGVRAGKFVFTASNLESMSEEHPRWYEEQERIDHLVEIMSNFGLEVVMVDISEFYKSGASLSCMVQHLNFVDYRY